MVSSFLRIGLDVFLLFLFATKTDGLSTFHQDVAFSYIDTDDVVTLPTNTYDDPPLLERRGTGSVFDATIPGTYVFTFQAPGKNVASPAPVNATNYRLVKLSGTPPSADLVLRLTADGPVSGHVMVELDALDSFQIETYARTVMPVANTTAPVIFNGFLLYHRCLCSPLVLRRSSFSASRDTDVAAGTAAIHDFDEVFNIGDEFDELRGIFTASLPGIYVFMYSFPNQGVGRSGTVTVSLTLNDAVKSSASSVSSTAPTSQYSGATVVLDLVEGDQVRLRKVGGLISIPTVIDGGIPVKVSPILFSGFLL
ncbi:uncharacterized protein LOC110974066 [Acanthaster planci]|uniref:Uncharacterized protein LOC110974066 n=1 Tax=Acanthaster planci TaxID=133434 RepID=A0A8B7XJW1_ACAPL|nr:uncharacterized protein LOC110974066 [Acanthaster planci]